MSKIRNILVLAGAMLLLSVAAFGQGGKGIDITKKIKFAKGKSTATVKGNIPDRNISHVYIVGAKAGQTMTLVFSSPRKDVDFCVAYPNGGEPENSCSKRKWTIVLPDDGDYQLLIDAKREPTPYTLTVTVK